MASRPSDLRGLERRLSILSSRFSGGIPVRVSLRPETDRPQWSGSARMLSLGIRSLARHPDVPALLELLSMHELGKSIPAFVPKERMSPFFPFPPAL